MPGLTQQLILALVQTLVVFACWDTPPFSDYTCVQQREFGACEAYWMIDGNYCDITCGRCCGDVPPDNLYSCQQQKEFGSCSESWMLQLNYCAQSCGRCSSSAGLKTSQEAVTYQGDCKDNKPDSIYTCAEQKSFGQCNQRWMLDGDYCAQTCDRCKPAHLARSSSSSIPSNNQDCGDVAPDNQFSCAEQKSFGQCSESWMSEGGFCQTSCGTCVSIPVGCSDNAPDSTYTCAQQKSFGACNQQWMKKDNYCQTTCGRCSPAPPGCLDIPPDNTYSCQNQKDFGKCQEQWMIDGKFCQITCGRCTGNEVPEAAVTSPNSVSSSTPIASVPKTGKKTNFLIIMTDDQGYDDIGVHNTNGILETPFMDAFARESVEFSNFYTDSLCAPSRATLLTGRQHLKTGVWGVHGGMDFIDLSEILMPQPLKQNGYYTAQIGKWHSGKTSGYFPFQRGYDLSITPHLYTFFNNRVRINGVEQRIQGLVENWMADEIISILQSRVNDGQPFFITWTPMSIHAGKFLEFESGEDFIAPDWALQKYANRGLPTDIQKVYAFITYWDTIFGKVITKLSDLGLADDTMVMFFGDNGPMMYDTDHRTGEFRYLRMPSQMLWDKGFIEEGGTRNFFFVRQSGVTSGGRVVDSNLYIADIFPTVMQLAGITPNLPRPLDGFSFAPLLFGNAWAHNNRIIITHESLKNTLLENLHLQLNEDRLVWLQQPLLNFDTGATTGIGMKRSTAIRQGDYKLIKGQLYDIRRGNHLEWPQYRVQDDALFQTLEDEGRNWWNNMLATEPNAFQKPIFLIGYNGETFSEILAYGANDWSPYHVVVNTHIVSGFREIGDYISLKVRVDSAGSYQFKLNYGWTGDKGAVFHLQVGYWDEIINFKAKSAKARLFEEQTTFPPIYLDVTQAPFQEMRLTLDDRDLKDSSDIFWWINLIEVFKL